MKKLLFFTCMLLISMQSMAQLAPEEVKITLQVQHETLQSALLKIEAQCNYRFAFKRETIDSYKDISVEKGTRSLPQTMDVLLAATSLKWEIIRSNIVLTEKNKPVQAAAVANETVVVSGVVKDVRGRPIAFASINSPELQVGTSTNEKGEYRIEANPIDQRKVATLVVSYVGKQEVRQTIQLNTKQVNTNFILSDLSLTLKDISVTGVRQISTASNSSIVFGKQAIEQVQATSIVDVLQYLPGQTITAPDLQNAKTINLRSNFSESRLDRNQAFVNNSAFGTAIIVDGSPVSNNANMQSLNIGKQGGIKNITAGVSTGSAGTGPTYAADFAGSGLDLRQIPTNNIESIEVVSGVASARYGDMTDGAIIVNRQAGRTNYNLSARFREGTANFQVEKGYSLGKRWGSMNVSLDYLYATADARDKTKYYNRVNTGLMWTTYLDNRRKFKHTFAFDLSKSLDGTKTDPDDKTLSTSNFKYSSLAISDRGEIKLNRKWSKSIQYNIRYSQTVQESYSQNFQNVASALFVTGTKQIGTAEGEVVPAYNYIYAQELKGKPVNFFARIENNFQLSSRTILHQFSVGATYSYDANKGEGWKYDYRKPPLSSSAGSAGYKSDRPYTFSEMDPVVTNFGAYLEDRVSMVKWRNPLDLRFGLRFDRQNRFSTLSPRISANWSPMPHFKLNAAYGIATKSPALVYTNPGPVYFDYPLIRAFNGVNGSNSLYLTYTDISYNRNLDLKPSVGTNYEVGATWNSKMIDVSLTFFWKNMRDGFTTVQQPTPKVLPVWDTLPRANLADKWGYYKTNRDTTYQSYFSKPINGLSSETNGIEVVVNTKKIKAIQTSFFFTTAYYRGKYKDASPDVNQPSTQHLNKEALYGVYNRPDATTSNIKSTLVTTHHFPKIGFVVNITGEYFWHSQSTVAENAVTYPIGYYDKNLNYFAIDQKNVNDAKYAHLVQLTTDYPTKKVPIVYTNFHMRLSKEIGNLRLSFNAYNIFNIRPEYIDNSNAAKPVVILNQEPSYGAELSIKF